MGESYQITEQCSGQRFPCKAGQSVLKAMEQQGLECVPVGCRGGWLWLMQSHCTRR